jgi:hypothetical protein
MSWCPEMYRGLFIHPVGKERIAVAPCCQATAIVQPVTAEFSFENSPHLEKFRNNVKPAGCFRCWETEDNGGYSKRLSAIDYYGIEENKQVELNALEYNVNWSCNLACIMCSPQFSSSWAKELNQEKNYINITHTQNKIVNELDKSKLSRIHFNGGEPLINDEHVKVLEQIENLSNCKVTYNTNGTKLPSDRALRSWEKSKMVRLFFSIDATEAAFEYIRWPGKWDELCSNIEWFIQNSPSNVMFGLNVTVGTYNLLEIPKLWEWYQKTIPTNREGDPTEFSWQTAHNFNYNWLNTAVKQAAKDKLKMYNGLTSLYNGIDDNNANDDWIDKLKVIDARRKTNWRKSLEVGKFY